MLRKGVSDKVVLEVKKGRHQGNQGITTIPSQDVHSLFWVP